MMDRELTDAFKDVKAAIHTGHARLEVKLDLVNEQFNKHLVDDAKAFTTLEVGQKQIETKIEAGERRRKEESERQLRKVEESKTRNDQLKYVKIAGYFAIAAAVIGTLASSLLSYIEAKSEREERNKVRIEEKLKPH